MVSTQPRDFVGYGRNPPDPRWPGSARLAVNINLNFEAGGERSILDGDAGSETVLSDTGFPSFAGRRSPLVETAFEYGSRVGVWRLLRIFQEFGVRVSVLAVARALERNPEATSAFIEAKHEIVSHGWRWLDYQDIDPDTERAHIADAVKLIAQLTGSAPAGWMTGRPSENTRRLLIEHGGFLYDRDALNDELPYYDLRYKRPHLVIPYSYETNDNRFSENKGFSTSADFAQYLIDAFDTLYEEGADAPRMMAIGLHDRLIGRPARAGALVRFLAHARKHDRVWFCTGAEISEHWHATFPSTTMPSR